MFTGIIRNIGKVRELITQDQGMVLVISCPGFFLDKKIGDSVAVNGVCLTVVDKTEDLAKFDIASETMRKTNLEKLNLECEVHLEQSLKVGDTIDGHFVYGHIDGCVSVNNISKQGETYRFEFDAKNDLISYVMPKGSVALDGVSLTVGEVIDTSFSVYIIPHTYLQTRFSSYKQGDLINFEADPISRYVFQTTKRILNV